MSCSLTKTSNVALALCGPSVPPVPRITSHHQWRPLGEAQTTTSHPLATGLRGAALMVRGLAALSGILSPAGPSVGPAGPPAFAGPPQPAPPSILQPGPRVLPPPPTALNGPGATLPATGSAFPPQGKVGCWGLGSRSLRLTLWVVESEQPSASPCQARRAARGLYSSLLQGPGPGMGVIVLPLLLATGYGPQMGAPAPYPGGLAAGPARMAGPQPPKQLDPDAIPSPVSAVSLEELFIH